MKTKKIEVGGLTSDSKGVKIDAIYSSISNKVYNITIEKKDDVYIITGERCKCCFNMYDNFSQNDISKVIDEHIFHKKKYWFFGELVPYINGYSELKKREPFTITTTNLTIVE